MNQEIRNLAMQLIVARHIAGSVNEHLFNPSTSDDDCEELHDLSEAAELLVLDLMTDLAEAVITAIDAPTPNYLERALLMLTPSQINQINMMMV